MRVLVSGFEPFLDEKVNPTEQIVRFVNSCEGHGRIGWDSLDVRGVLLPVLFDKAFQRLEQERLLFSPDIILSFGLAAGRNSIDIEQLAVNLRGGTTAAVSDNRTDPSALARIARADNAGTVGSGTIIESAPQSLPTTLPTEMLMKALAEAGVPARRSNDAGTYVCNDLFFQMQNHSNSTNVRSGFIHVPRLCAENTFDGNSFAGHPESETAWSWPRLEKAVTTILSALANEKN